MYGHGAAPPTPSGASVITQRVLYAAAGLLCCGLLACVPLFRVAFLRGRTLDWAAAWVSIPLAIACGAVAGSLPESDYRTDLAVFVMLTLGAAATAYFLIVDIRFHRRQGPYAAQVPLSPHSTTMHAPGVHTPYGYPQQVSPYASTPVPQPQAPHTPVPPQPQPQPPQRPAPARIDQVRAELDELSDYLRRQDGQQGQQGNSEGGR